MTDDEIDVLWTALSNHGWQAPHMANALDYDTLEELQAADRETNRLNRESLHIALNAAGIVKA